MFVVERREFNKLISMNRSSLLSLNQFAKIFHRTLTELQKFQWEGVVGLEIHAHLQTESKLFSGAGTNFAAIVNNQVSLFDAAIPGTLPALNRECVRKAVLAALALNCDIHPTSWFDRKHYFYADLPAGYQITQQRLPFATNGYLEFPCCKKDVNKPFLRKSKIKQIQLEQDSGKSLHDDQDKQSLIDLNRAGMPLIEIVFEPDLADGYEAAYLVEELMLVLKALNACSCKVAEGALRVDANVSVRQRGSDVLGVRTEVKNIAGITNVLKAVNFEVERQIRMCKYNKDVVNETRAWDADLNRTVGMRDKEVEQDYRFMPEPNLPPLRLSLDESNKDPNLICVPKLRKLLPELPFIKRKELTEEYALPQMLVLRLLETQKLVEYFVFIMKNYDNVKTEILANFLLNDVLGAGYRNKVKMDTCVMNPAHLAELYNLFLDQVINRVILIRLLDIIIVGSDKTPNEIIDENQWWQVNDLGIIEESCRLTIEYNPEWVEDYRKSKRERKKHLQTLLNEALKNTEWRANIKLTKETLEKMLVEEKK